ncbi:hypothetical protein RD792_017228 [Penstemon davidsonii]|uniref:Histidine-containing phosphotransfer protein n=1 Tax=Penstemon davidsonii TaxID=160366 RepID=A0ABR0CLF3_9LAMI|nr:hypothetical protein RD792_017228 [Penstemon davidsonii]
MEVNQMQRSFLEYANVLFREGFLDGQFSQLQMLADESNPDFVVEVVSLFFEDSQKLLNDLTTTLDQQNVDFKKIDAHIHQLKGSSSSIGAQRVKNACIAFRNFCDQQNVEGLSFGSSITFAFLFQLEQQIVAAGGAIPILSEFS